MNINYKDILDYLANNQEIPYSNPDAPGLTQDERNRLLKVKEKGQAAVSEMKKIAARCGKLYGLDRCSAITWLDSSNTKTKKYLWAQMRYKDYADNPISISLFVEKNNDVTRYRISLEIKDSGADKRTMEAYHSHLDKPKNDEMVYVSGNDEWGNPIIITNTPDEIKNKIAAGEINKVQLCIFVESAAEKTNEQYDTDIMNAVKRIIPYYEYVIGRQQPGRRELADTEEALQKMNLDNIDIKYNNDAQENKPYFDKNMILYGPPGTGKTYNTAIYAVAICDGFDINTIKKMDYAKVMARYKELTSAGRIEFITFHQSYEYEEFIRAINSNDLNYCYEQLEKSIAVCDVQTKARIDARVIFPND